MLYAFRRVQQWRTLHAPSTRPHRAIVLARAAALFDAATFGTHHCGLVGDERAGVCYAAGLAALGRWGRTCGRAAARWCASRHVPAGNATVSSRACGWFHLRLLGWRAGGVPGLRCRLCAPVPALTGLLHAPTPAAARCPSVVAGVRSWLDRRNIVSRISEALEREPFMCVLCLRISPINASGVLSYLLGLTAVPLRAYTAASALGGAPMAAVFVYLGTAIDSLAELATGRAPQDARTGLLLVCGGAGCFVGMLVAARLAAQRLREAERLMNDGTHDGSTHDSCDASSGTPEGRTDATLGDRSSETHVVPPACATQGATKGPLAWTRAECGEPPSAVLTILCTARIQDTLAKQEALERQRVMH